MEIRQYNEGDVLVSQLKARREEDKIILNFKWPNSLEHICVYKKSILKSDEIDETKPYRKYTKEEYVKFGGFIDYVTEVGLIHYIICPHILEGDKAYVIWSHNEENSIDISTGKIEIRYTIKEKKKLFSSRKTIQMTLFCDTEIPRELICYTKKRGEIPLNNQDGSRFQFVQDFNAGQNILPEIEVDKEEYIRIYLADNIAHQELYWIYKQ